MDATMVRDRARRQRDCLVADARRGHRHSNHPRTYNRKIKSMNSSTHELDKILSEAEVIALELRAMPRAMPKPVNRVADLVRLFRRSGLTVSEFANRVHSVTYGTLRLWNMGMTSGGSLWPQLLDILKSSSMPSSATVSAPSSSVTSEPQRRVRARPLTVWLDDAGNRHDSEAEADRASTRLHRTKAAAELATYLQGIEGLYSRDTLATSLVDGLAAEAAEPHIRALAAAFAEVA